MMIAQVVGIVITLSGTAAQGSDIPDLNAELGGRHWVHSRQQTDLKKLEAAYVRLSKVGASYLRDACEQYIKGTCPSDPPLKKGEYISEWTEQLRNFDVAVLNRLLFHKKLWVLKHFDVETGSVMNAGPVWSFKDGVPTLNRGRGAWSWDHINAIVEFDILWYAK